MTDRIEFSIDTKTAVAALRAHFRLGPAATALLPDLCDSFAAHDWHRSLIDQVHGPNPRSKGGAVGALQRAGVVTLQAMDPCATLNNQKQAVLTARARQVLREASAAK